jgi:hypothetical protein
MTSSKSVSIIRIVGRGRLKIGFIVPSKQV